MQGIYISFFPPFKRTEYSYIHSSNRILIDPLKLQPVVGVIEGKSRRKGRRKVPSCPISPYASLPVNFSSFFKGVGP